MLAVKTDRDYGALIQAYGIISSINLNFFQQNFPASLTPLFQVEVQ